MQHLQTASFPALTFHRRAGPRNEAAPRLNATDTRWSYYSLDTNCLMGQSSAYQSQGRRPEDSQVGELSRETTCRKTHERNFNTTGNAVALSMRHQLHDGTGYYGTVKCLPESETPTRRLAGQRTQRRNDLRYKANATRNALVLSTRHQLH